MTVLPTSALDGALPIFQRELGAYFRSPVATVFLVVFLLAALGCPFFLGSFYRSNHAGLELFFVFHPWLYLFLVPALGMSVWAEEFQHSTILQLFTLPVSVGAAVIAKFFAAWIFLGLALLLTFPIVATVFYLGHPDVGPILTGYVGSFLMAGVYLAITTCTSAIGRNQIVSYVLSTILCLILVLLGQGALIDLLNPIFPVWLVDVISRFSFSTHFLPLSLGRIDSRDIVYFVSLIAFFLIVNTLVVHVKIGRVQARRAVLTVSHSLLTLISVNVIGHYLPASFDTTEDKVHTISAGTRKILSGVEDPVLLKFFFSRSNDELPPNFKLYAQQVQNLLKEYVRLSEQKLVLEVIDPQPDTFEEEWARRYGLRRTLLADGSSMYFGLQALTADREFVIPYFDPGRAGELEHDLSQRILRVGMGAQGHIGVIGLSDMDSKFGARFSGLVGELRRSYAVSFLPKDVNIADDIKLIVVVWTAGEALEQQHVAQEDRIRKFVERGGKLLVVVDPLFGSRSPSNGIGGATRVFPYRGLFGDLGLAMASGEIVGDLKSAGAVQNPGLGKVRHPFVVRLGAEGLHKNDLMARGLNDLVFLHSGHLQPIAAPSAADRSEFVPLISSSTESSAYEFYRSPILPLYRHAAGAGRATGLPTLLSHSGVPHPNESEPQFSMGPNASENTRELQTVEKRLRDTQSPKTLAGLITRRKGASNAPVAIVIADADFVSDDLAISQPHPAFASAFSSASTPLNNNALPTFGQFDLVAETAEADVQQTYQTANDNLRFVLNAVDFLLGNEALAGVRSRGLKSRDFSLLRDMQEAAQKKFLLAEENSVKNLAGVRQKLDEAIKSQEKDQKASISGKQREEIRRFLELEVDGKKELAATRRLLRESIDTLGNRLLWLNLLPVPLLVAFAGGVYAWRRSRRRIQLGKL